jgi:hypothetical protein
MKFVAASRVNVPAPGRMVPLIHAGRKVGEAALLGDRITGEVTDVAVAAMLSDLIERNHHERAKISLGYTVRGRRLNDEIDRVNVDFPPAEREKAHDE